MGFEVGRAGNPWEKVGQVSPAQAGQSAQEKQEKEIRAKLEHAVLIIEADSAKRDELTKAAKEKAKDEIIALAKDNKENIISLLKTIQTKGVSVSAIGKYVGDINAASRSGRADDFYGSIFDQKNAEFRAFIDEILKDIK